MRYKRKDILLFAGVFVVVLLALGVGWFVQTDEPFCSTVAYEGEGTEANPYEVENVRQLQCIGVRGGEANYTQVSDIDASETSEWNSGEGFEPIEFDDTFDGQGYNITNLTINRRGEAGLFSLNTGQITNVSLVNVEATGYAPVGGLVGENSGTVSNSYASGSVEGSSIYTGGLVGINFGTISKSHASVSVDGEEEVGGLVGVNFGGGVIENSYSDGSVDGTRVVGSLVGRNHEDATVSNSYATGSVEGDEEVGGLVGSNTGGIINESYATGSVNGSVNVGGLVGLNEYREFEGTVTESYWDMEKTGQSASAGNGTGLNTSEITGSAARGNMTGFNFTSTWETVTDPDDYPVLAWQAERDTHD
jgi:hypothetical protein